MENKKNNYRVIEESRLVYLLELEQLVERLGFGFSPLHYKEVKKTIGSRGYVQKELEKHEILSDVLKEVLDAENVFEVSDEEKEDSLYIQEFDSCGYGCCSDNYDDSDEDEVEGTYVIVYLEEDDDDYDEDDYDEDNWADEFDDFYSDSLENSIFKEMEDFVNGKYISSTEEEDEEEKFIAGPQLYEILKDYFKQIFD